MLIQSKGREYHTLETLLSLMSISSFIDRNKNIRQAIIAIHFQQLYHDYELLIFVIHIPEEEVGVNA